MNGDALAGLSRLVLYLNVLSQSDNRRMEFYSDKFSDISAISKLIITSFLSHLWGIFAHNNRQYLRFYFEHLRKEWYHITVFACFIEHINCEGFSRNLGITKVYFTYCNVNYLERNTSQHWNIYVELWTPAHLQ